MPASGGPLGPAAALVAPTAPPLATHIGARCMPRKSATPSEVPLSRSRLTLLAASLLMLSTPAWADRRYFVQTYTPYLAPAENLEFETWAIAQEGRGDSTNTSWQTRAEFEYSISDRLTGAAYLNFVQDAGGPQRFDGPSLEVIYQLAEPGKMLLDPAVYLEVRESGEELELEPKLLLGRRHDTWVAAANVIGEFEYLHNAPAGYEDSEKKLELTLGVSREFGAAFAIGLEGSYRSEFVDNATDPSALFLGPTINLQSSKIQLSIGWHPQISGSPSTHGGRNLADAPRSEFRMIIGVDL